MSDLIENGIAALGGAALTWIYMSSSANNEVEPLQETKSSFNDSVQYNGMPDTSAIAAALEAKKDGNVVISLKGDGNCEYNFVLE